MSGALALLLGRATSVPVAVGVDIQGGSLTRIRAAPSTSTVSYALQSDSLEVGTAGVGAFSRTYQTGGSASAYDVRATVTSGALTSGTTGAWLNLGTTRTWTCSTVGGVESADLLIEVRDATTLVVVDSATVSLYAESN